MMNICEYCKGIVGLSAMAITECEKCGEQVVTGHIPHYKYCSVCAVELDVCKQCGKHMNEQK